MKYLFLILVLSPVYSQAALTKVQPLEQMESNSRNHETVTCNNLQAALDNWHRELFNHNRQVYAELRAHGDVINSWYYQLRQYEGRTVMIPYGSFNNIGNSASTVYSNSQIIDKNSSQLENEFANLKQVAANCANKP